MILELTGSPHSTCTQRVLIIANELGLEISLKPIDFSKGEHKTLDYLKYQPFGQVPYLVDGDFVLFESRAICRYLARKYGKGKLLANESDIVSQAMFDQGASIEMADFDPSISGIVAEKVFSRYRGLEPDEAKVDKYIQTCKLKLEGYERILAKQKYLCGDEITMVDLFHLPYGTMAEPFIPGGFEEHPNVSRWWGGLKSRDSWVKASAKPN